MKLRDALGKYQDYYYKMAVWEEITNHLRTFSSAGGIPTDKKIKAMFGLQEHVPEEVVLGMIQEIELGPISALDTELESLGDMDIADDEKKKQPASKPKKGSAKSGGAGRRKPLRAVQE